MKLWRKFLRLADRVHRYIYREAGVMIGTETLIAIGISLAISAISYGLQLLLAPTPPTITGARKDDLGGPLSKPGQPMPYAVGRNLSRGQVIWTSGIVETKHVDKVKGGKGGGKSQKVESFTYSVSLAVAFNDGPIECLLRVLGNGTKTIFSERLGERLTNSQINQQVNAKYDEVYDADYAYWTSLTDSEGNQLYTNSQAAQTADANATTESEQLREELKATQRDSKLRYSEMEIHYGTETQDPSPIIESFEGSGNVPAFRGTAYVVFRDLQLADFGNSAPVMEFDYGTSGVGGGGDPMTSDGEFEVGTALTGSPLDTAVGVADDNWGVDFTAGKAYMSAFDSGDENFILEFDTTTLELTNVHRNLTPDSALSFIHEVDSVTGYIHGQWWGFSDQVEDYVYDPETETIIAHFNSRDEDDVSNFSTQTTLKGTCAVYSPSQTAARLLSVRNANGTVAVHNWPSLAPLVKYDFTHFSSTTSGFVRGRPGEAFAQHIAPATITIKKFTVSDAGANALNSAYETISASAVGSGGNFIDTASQMLWYAGPDSWIVAAFQLGYTFPDPVVKAVVFKWTKGNSAPDWIVSSPNDGSGQSLYPILTAQCGPLEKFNYDLETGPEHLIIPTTTASTYVWKINVATGEVVFQDQGLATGSLDLLIWDDVNKCQYSWQGMENDPETDLALRRWCWNLICGTDPISLTTVVASYLQKAGYSESEYDIDSAMDDETIYGFNNNNGRTVREILEDLAKIRPVAAFESERKLKFKLLDSTTRATIPISDIRAYEGKSNPPEWLNEVTTLEDLALPASLQINYQDQDLLLNTTPVYFKREVTESDAHSEFSVEAVDNAENMRRSVFNAMGQLMVTKRTFKFNLPQKYQALEPGDRLTVPISDTRTADVRITRIDRGANGLLEVTCVRFLDYDFQVELPDEFANQSPDTADVLLASRFHFIDTPYLTDSAEENEAGLEDRGIYVAVSNNRNAPGANLYVDANDLVLVSDGGSPPTYSQAGGDPEWELAETFTSFIDDGLYVRGLSPTAVPYVVDTVSKFVVSWNNPDAAFSSISDTAILYSQDNVFKIGNEILQAKTATLIGTSPGGLKTYEFTNLYRGLQGTEWAISESGGPGSGAPVIHLNPNGIKRVDFDDINLVGKTITFRVTTVGQEIADADDNDNVFYSRSRLPWAPGIDNVQRDVDGNLTFNLLQRLRYGGDWTDEALSPPFTTDPWNFEVDIIDNSGSPGSVIRTLTVSGDPYPAFSYTAAQQQSDFGSPIPASVDVRPYQLNADGTRGFTNEETI